MTKLMKRVHQLLDAGYKWRQAFAIAKNEERTAQRKKKRK